MYKLVILYLMMIMINLSFWKYLINCKLGSWDVFVLEKIFIIVSVE